MKEFTSAAVEAVEDADRETRIKALLAAGKTRSEAEAETEEDSFIEFKLDGRTLKAYTPTPGQLAFLLANMGRGQTKDGRFASVMNVMLESLDEDDQEYLESRLLTRRRGKMMDLKKLEEIFEHLVEEWFATPTQGQ